MVAKINKALDLNKLFEEQSKGKLLKKNVVFPILTSLKYDGNYVIVKVLKGFKTFMTSGGLTYNHTDDGAKCFEDIVDGYYLAERIWGLGKLGDRNKCNLKGPKHAQTSTGHTYKVHHYLTITEYERGEAFSQFREMSAMLIKCNLPYKNIVINKVCNSQKELDILLEDAATDGYEGIMGKAFDWVWKHHKTTRAIGCIKYKKRPSVDLLCIGWKKGEGKYEGVTGSLRMRDSKGREVNVGSGMSDTDRCIDPDYFVGKVCEIEYEQIVNTYVQATHPPLNEGVLVRHDKTKEDIN